MSAGLFLWYGSVGLPRVTDGFGGGLGGFGLGGGGLLRGSRRGGFFLSGGGCGCRGRGGGRGGDDDGLGADGDVALDANGQEILRHALNDGLRLLPVGVVADDALMIQAAGHIAVFGEHHRAVRHPCHKVIVPIQPVAVAGGLAVVDARRHGGVVDLFRRLIGIGQ